MLVPRQSLGRVVFARIYRKTFSLVLVFGFMEDYLMKAN